MRRLASLSRDSRSGQAPHRLAASCRHPAARSPGPFVSASRPGAVESDRHRGDSSGGEPIPMFHSPFPTVHATSAPVSPVLLP